MAPSKASAAIDLTFIPHTDRRNPFTLVPLIGNGNNAPYPSSRLSIRHLFSARNKLHKRSGAIKRGILYRKEDAVEEDRQGMSMIFVCERELLVKEDVKNEVGREVVGKLTPIEWPRWRIF